MKIDCQEFTLRSLKKQDAEPITRKISSKKILKWLSIPPYPYKLEHAKSFISDSIKKEKKQESFNFAITKDNELIGIISLSNITLHKSATLGYWLAEKYWNKGIMTKAVKEIIKFGFNKLKLNRIETGHFADNLGSKRIIEKNGFKYEGTLKKKFYRFKKWHDEIIYAILNSK